MSKLKWELNPKNVNEIWVDELEVGIGFKHTLNIDYTTANGFEPISKEDSLCNAKLIAAAPKLLQTILDVKDWLESENKVRNGTHIRLIESIVNEVVS